MQEKNGGLSARQAAERLQREGPNRLAQGKKAGVAAMFFSQFKDVMILILAAATLVSAALGQTAEAAAMIAIVLVNALMGFVQEWRTERTLEALGRMAAPAARVRRDGREQTVDAETVVPGDVLLLDEGARIPADARVVSAAGLRCDESMLTGESVPVDKAAGDEVYMGCTVASGHAEALVLATGMRTQMGRIAGMVDAEDAGPTPLQEKLRALGRVVAALCVGVCCAVALLGLAQGAAPLDMLLTGVSLAVAAVPEGLPAIVTVTLALSVGRILRRGALIRRLHAVETLGCSGVICTDKTGTVTQNRMTVQQLWTAGEGWRVGGAPDAADGAFERMDGAAGAPVCTQGPAAGRPLTADRRGQTAARARDVRTAFARTGRKGGKSARAGGPADERIYTVSGAFSGAGAAPSGPSVPSSDPSSSGAIRAQAGAARVQGLSVPVRTLLESAALCTTATAEVRGGRCVTSGDATETALLVAAAKGGVTKRALAARFAVLEEEPFDAARRYMAVTVRAQAGRERIVKGAPETVLALCTHWLSPHGVRPLDEAARAQITAAAAQMEAQAMRVLAVARTAPAGRRAQHAAGGGGGEQARGAAGHGAGAAAGGGDKREAPRTAPAGRRTQHAAGGGDALCFAGLLGMLDPPRPEVPHAVRRCRAAGIKPVMITGDAPRTALAIAQRVGIAQPGDGVLTGADLDAMDDAALAAACPGTAVYARVTPAHKLRIVRALRAAGQVTAMTGDGVNDAPALKAADIGVAMGRGGTDAARSAAGLVILDDNFATIVAAVEEGRTVYRNIRRSVRFLLASNLGEVLSMLFCMALGLAPSLVPIQILMVNLLTDGLPAVALGLEPPAEDVMRTPPRPRGESLFAHGLGREIALRGTVLGAASCAVYAAALTMGAPLAAARSACFLTVVFCQLVHLFEDRGAPLSANPALAWAAALSGAAALAGVYLPAAHTLLGTAPVTGRLALYTALAVCAPGLAVRFGRRLWGGAKV